MYASSEAEELN